MFTKRILHLNFPFEILNLKTVATNDYENEVSKILQDANLNK